MNKSYAIALLILGAVILGSVFFSAWNPGTNGEDVAKATEEAGAAETVAEPLRARLQVPVVAEVPTVKARFACGFTGRVVDAGGSAVKGILVEFSRLDSLALALPGLSFGDTTIGIDRRTTTTGEDGRFLVSGFAPRGMFVIDVGKGSRVRASRLVDRTPVDGEIVDLGDIAVGPTASVIGSVFGPDGQPIVGATVRAIAGGNALLEAVPFHRIGPASGAMVDVGSDVHVFRLPTWVEPLATRMAATTKTKKGGEFRLTGLGIGSVRIVFVAPGLAPRVLSPVRCSPNEATDVGQISLGRGVSAHGTVSNADGSPVAGAEVLVADGGPMRFRFGSVHLGKFARRTDAGGGFHVSGLARNRAHIAVRRAAGEPWSLHRDKSLDSGVDLTLPARGSLHVRIVGDHEICGPDCNVTLTNGGIKGFSRDMPRLGLVKPMDLGQRTKWIAARELVIDDLPEGKYGLTIACDARSTGLVGVDVRGVTKVTVELKLARTWKIRVEDENGSGVAEATVVVKAVGAPPRVPWFPTTLGTTSAQGELETRFPIQGGKVQFAASHPAFGRVQTERPGTWTEEVILRMQQPGSVIGRLRERGRPPTPGRWTIVARRIQSSPLSQDFPPMTTPAPNGEFQFGKLAPGTYQLEVRRDVAASWTTGRITRLLYWSANWRESVITRKVTVAAGKSSNAGTMDSDHDHDFVGEAGRIHGIVSVNGQTAKRQWVITFVDGHRSVARVGESGRFDLGKVRVGRVLVSVVEERDSIAGRASPGPIWTTRIDLTSGDQRELVIRISTGSIAGVVEPLTMDVAVFAVGSAKGLPGLRLRASVDPRGSFKFDRLPLGDYKVWAIKDGYVSNVVDLRVEESGRDCWAALRFKRSLKVVGTIDTSATGRESLERVQVVFERVGDEPGFARTVLAHCTKDLNVVAQGLSRGTWKIKLSGPRLPAKKGWEWTHGALLELDDESIEGLRITPIRTLTN